MSTFKIVMLVWVLLVITSTPAHSQLLKALVNSQERAIPNSKTWKANAPDVSLPLHFRSPVKPTQLIVGTDHPNGTKLWVMFPGCGISLPVDFGKDFKGFDEFGFLTDGYSIQVAEHDFNGDGMPELVVAVGDGSMDLAVNVLRYIPPASSKNACSEKNWSRLGSFTGQGKALISGNKIMLPYASQGLFEEYTLNKQKFVRTN